VTAAVIDIEYVLPLKSEVSLAGTPLTGYLVRLGELADVTVVDGSPEPVFAEHARHWRAAVRHTRPEPWPGGNGKVAGVMTGLRAARHEAVVIADDDVRYTPQNLAAMGRLLGRYDVVRPQNYFASWPWHARWDTARTLVNRAVASDFPGTLGVLRTRVLAAGGYRGDVLFENLELLRTVRAAGGTERRADDLFVERVPPSAAHFVSQRVRQAYDDFAQPARAAVELSLLPGLLWAAMRPRRLVAPAAAACLLAAVGRARSRGGHVFPVGTVLWAPVWVVERAACVWIAVGARALGGVRYRGDRLRVAASPARVLRRRLAATGGGSRAR